MTDISPEAFDDPWVGRVIDERYRIVEQIGRGATGVVYRVEHVRMGKVAAMKLLHSSLSADPAITRRFHNEAEAISRLNHPNIVQVFDFGQAERTLYIVMEYLHGRNLGAILERDGPHSLARCVPILVQVCHALTEAHSLGIVHRDLKPENIQVSRMQSGRDVVKVVDFGLAKMVAPGSQPGETGKGKLVGTPYYMAPEQIRGRELDQRCDIYGLGAVAYRTLTGEPPFDAETPMGVLTKHVTEALMPPSERSPQLKIPCEIDGVLLQAMAKRKEDRFDGASEFKAALLDAANRSIGSNASGPSGITPAVHPARPIEIERRTTPPEDEATGPDQHGVAAQSVDTLPPRLTRQDVDFESHLRRASWLKLLAVLLALTAAGAAYYWFAMREKPEVAASQEREPNNAPAQATLIAADQAVTGRLGKRLSEQESDRDWYRLELEAEKRLGLRVVASGIPNMDLTVALYDARGKRLAAADSAAQGIGETIVDWPVEGELVYVMVREVWRVGTIPTENVTDEYTLRASVTPLAEGWEREPNDTPESAGPITTDAPISGTLGAVNDHDTYRLEVGKGTLSGTLSAVSGVDVVLELSGDQLRKRTIDQQGLSAGERLRPLRVRQPSTLLLTVRRKNDRKQKDAPPAGLDQPYTLRLWTQAR